jgi:pyrroline-5-carboxylate reductase
MSTVVFLGGGRITSAMLAGLRLAKSTHRFVVHDRHPEKLRMLRKQYGAVIEADLRRAVAGAEAATPGGTAAATMAGMDAAGYGRAVRAGVQTGLARARANARG